MALGNDDTQALSTAWLNMTEPERQAFGAVVGADKVARMDGLIDNLLSLQAQQIIEDADRA